MVTAEEIAEVAVFAALGADDRERLSRRAADISLRPGEYAADEGGERALFAVLEGRIEAVKLEDGVERVVGERQPGDLFGEVPIVLGTVFPVGFRAAESSRVMRVDAHDYHAVAAVAPDVATEVSRLARHRMGGTRGLQGLAAEPPPPRAIVVGHRWDPSCTELRRFLERNQITFSWITPDSPEAASSGAGCCPRRKTSPPSGSWTARPSSGRARGAWPSCSASAPSPPRPSTTRWWWAPARRAWPRPCTAPPRAWTPSWWSGRRPAARPAPRH